MVDFSHFNEFFVKTLKIHNFANNHSIFTGLVLNDVEYKDLQLFFCIKINFIKNKKVIQLQRLDCRLAQPASD